MTQFSSALFTPPEAKSGDIISTGSVPCTKKEKYRRAHKKGDKHRKDRYVCF